MKISKNLAIFLASVLLALLSETFFINAYSYLFPWYQGSLITADPEVIRFFAGFILSFIFFPTLLFTAFGGKEKYLWIKITLIPAIFLEIVLDFSHIYFPITIAIIAFLLGSGVESLIEKNSAKLINNSKVIKYRNLILLIAAIFISVLSIVPTLWRYQLDYIQHQNPIYDSGFDWRAPLEPLWFVICNSFIPPFIFFLTAIFAAFGGSKKYWWIGAGLTPVLFFEAYFKLQFLYLDIVSAIVAWLLGSAISLVVEKIIHK